jgi:hypothetical protein
VTGGNSGGKHCVKKQKYAPVLPGDRLPAPIAG